jgi:transcriptional regulator with GAF, ATPase, and Fis domain
VTTRDGGDETVRSPLDRPSAAGELPARLVVVFPPGLRTVVSLGKGELELGRKPDGGGLVLDDPTVSRRHFVLRTSGGRHVGADTGSRNGSRVDGRDASEAIALDNGSVLRVGDVLLVYERGPARGDDARVSDDAVPGVAAATAQLRAQLAAAGVDPAPVLLVGETGTGKEHVARELHRLSGRRGPFVGVNCAALGRELIESQLFGHARGAFTGAHGAHEGLFRAADGGSLFLDEIGEMPLELQPKLLRALEEREVQPLGETRPVKIDVRVLSATLGDLAALVELGRFRLDLYARLSPWEIRVPPLRERRADILAWVERFHRLWHQMRARQTEAIALDAAAAERLLLHRWDDNLRGLARVVHRACADPSRPPIDAPPLPELPSVEPSGARPDKPTREELERVLEAAGSVRAAAKHFGRDRRQIYRWMEQYDLKEKDKES